MPILVADHHLKDFDSWIKIFKENPPPKIGNWQLLRGTQDRNRVCVVGEMEPAEAAEVEGFFESEEMRKVFAQVNEMSTAPMEVVWFEDITPG